MSADVSIGLAGALGPELIARVAPLVEEAGFRTLWVNDTPQGDALAALAAAARSTSTLHLATGVIPIDRRPAPAIVDDVAALALPTDRLLLGIGSGRIRHGALESVREAVETMRSRLDARVVVGALGPRMRQLGAASSDGVLLNWLPAEEAARQSADLHDRHPGTRVIAYVRTALDEAAAPRLREEVEKYAAIPSYAANLARMGVSAADTVFADETALKAGLPAYRSGVDEVVLRAITAGDGFDELADFIERSAPAPA